MQSKYSCEIISIGTEILLGNVTNTNARDLSEMLSGIGINVFFHSVVGDNPERIRRSIEIAKERVNIIITTGGLGPTCDDLTKKIVAEAFDLRLEYNQKEIDHITLVESAFGEIPESNFSQALLPEGCTVFHNNYGVAPGCGFMKDGVVVVMLPGVPTECNHMFRDSAIPFLQQFSKEVIVSHTVNAYGLTESMLDERLREKMETMSNPSMAPYAKGGSCFIRVTAKAESIEAAEQMVAPVIHEVEQQLGDYVYGVDVSSLEQRLMDIAASTGISFAIADACTGGSVAKRITDVESTFQHFKGGSILAPESAVLNVMKTINLAKEVWAHFKADFALAICGEIPPKGMIQENNNVYFALTDEMTVITDYIDLNAVSNAAYARHIVGNFAFDMMRRYLLGRK